MNTRELILANVGVDYITRYLERGYHGSGYYYQPMTSRDTEEHTVLIEICYSDQEAKEELLDEAMDSEFAVETEDYYSDGYDMDVIMSRKLKPVPTEYCAILATAPFKSAREDEVIEKYRNYNSEQN